MQPSGWSIFNQSLSILTSPPPVSNYLSHKIDSQSHKETGSKEHRDDGRWHIVKKRIHPLFGHSEYPYNPEGGRENDGNKREGRVKEGIVRGGEKWRNGIRVREGEVGGERG